MLDKNNLRWEGLYLLSFWMLFIMLGNYGNRNIKQLVTFYPQLEILEKWKLLFSSLSPFYWVLDPSHGLLLQMRVTIISQYHASNSQVLGLLVCITKLVLDKQSTNWAPSLAICIFNCLILLWFSASILIPSLYIYIILWFILHIHQSIASISHLFYSNSCVKGHGISILKVKLII